MGLLIKAIPPYVWAGGMALIFTTGMSSGIYLTRMFYKAGDVDRLKAQNEALVKNDHLKDKFLDRVDAQHDKTVAQMDGIMVKYQEVVAVQPTHTKTVERIFKDAPQKYAEFDPKMCLSFIYPDGLQYDTETAINSQIAGLPYFDNRGRRAVRPAIGRTGLAGGPNDLAGLQGTQPTGDALQRAPLTERPTR
jgi:hypothetical protein